MFNNISIDTINNLIDKEINGKEDVFLNKIITEETISYFSTFFSLLNKKKDDNNKEEIMEIIRCVIYLLYREIIRPKDISYLVKDEYELDEILNNVLSLCFIELLIFKEGPETGTKEDKIFIRDYILQLYYGKSNFNSYGSLDNLLDEVNQIGTFNSYLDNVSDDNLKEISPFFLLRYLRTEEGNLTNLSICENYENTKALQLVSFLLNMSEKNSLIYLKYLKNIYEKLINTNIEKDIIFFNNITKKVILKKEIFEYFFGEINEIIIPSVENKDFLFFTEKLAERTIHYKI